MTRSGRWIPPQGLIFGQLAHGASWIVLLVLALREQTGFGLPALGWMHLVALGWLTMSALSVLVHVIPAFTDVVWRWETFARRSLAVYAAGVLLLVAGFCANAPRILPWGGAIVVLGLAGYAVPAAFTLARAFHIGRVEAAIARALSITLICLIATAALGVTFTLVLNGWVAPGVLSAGVPIHAELGLIGWLTLLAMGVSVRTVGPITGARSPRGWAHIVQGFAMVLGMLVLGCGAALRAPVVLLIGMVITGVGVAVYAGDLAAVLQRATVPHRPPQAFLACAVFWLVAAFALGVGILNGAPWGPAFAYVTLIGWLGQIVNAHLHHIGVRLLSTAIRGDADETRPGELLWEPLSWLTFALFQIALIAGAIALLLNLSGLLDSAAVAGLLGWIAMLANTLFAVRRASLPRAD